MKIFLGEIVLAAGTAIGEEPLDLKIFSSRLVQTVYALRSDTSQPLDRGNITIRIEFRVRKKHRSIAEAQEYVIEQNSLLNQLNSTLTLIPEPKGTVFCLKDAVIQSTECSLNGNTSECFYKIIGGNLEIGR